MPPFALALPAILKGAGAAASIGNSIASFFSAGKMKKEADAINPVWDYKKSNEADEMKGFTQMRLNARNPLAELNRRTVLGGQANTIAGAEKNAIDPSQLLALASASEGQVAAGVANQAAQDLAYEQANVGNYMQALNTGVNQDNIENQFMAEKFKIDQDRKDALKTASRQTTSNAFSNLSSGLLSAGGLVKGGSTGGGSDIASMLAKFMGKN